MKNTMSPFATAILSITQRLTTGGLSKRERTILGQTISDILKKAGDLHPSGCSVAAQKEFKKINPTEDLRDKTWHQQPKFDSGRRIFHREHSETVSSLRDLCIADNTQAGILSILVLKVRIVWVLKSEDRILTANGDRSDREDWKVSYRNASIKVTPPANGWPKL